MVHNCDTYCDCRCDHCKEYCRDNDIERDIDFEKIHSGEITVAGNAGEVKEDDA